MPRLRESHSYATIFPAQTRRKEDKPMKKGIIFDLDGTLINSLPDISAAMNRALAKAGLPVHPEEAYKYLVGDGVIKLSERAVGARPELAPQVLADYMPDYAQNCRVNTHPYAGIPEALAGLAARGLKICVLTNKDQSDAEHILAYYFPAVHFSAVRGRVPGVALKPHPQGALLIAKALEIAPEVYSHFDAALAGQDPREFFEDTLLRRLRARHLVIGFHYRFGKAAAGNAALIQAYCEQAGIGLSVIPPVRLENGELVSSTAVRGLLQVGQFAAAREMLGHGLTAWPQTQKEGEDYAGIS